MIYVVHCALTIILRQELRLALPSSILLCVGLVFAAVVAPVSGFHATTVDTTLEEKFLKLALDYIAVNRTQIVKISLIDDLTRQPLVGAPVVYRQTTHDFIFGAGGVWGEQPFTDLWRRLGVDWGSLPLEWANIESSESVFDFREPDSYVKKLSDMGVEHFYVELRVYPEPGPTWEPPPWANWRVLLTNASFFDVYKQYVYEFVYNAAFHFRERVKVWETQLEYNWRRCNICGPAGPEDDYYLVPFTVEQSLELTKIQANAIRDAIPDALILLGASDPMKHGLNPNHYRGRIDPLDWTKMALAYGVDLDGVGIEANYANGPPSVFYNYLQEFLKLGKPTWNNEARYSAAPLVEGTEFQSDQPHWQTFDEETQALWAKYMITYAFAFGLGINWFPFYDHISPGYPASVNRNGLVDANGHARKAYFVYQDLIRQFTTNGTDRTDAEGEIMFRGFPGNYTISVEGYDPVTLRIPQGRTGTTKVTLEHTKTTEYYQTMELVNQAHQSLANLTEMNLQSPESKELAQQATQEYEMAAASLDKWEINAAKLHAERSRQLAAQSLQAEARYQEQLQSTTVPIAGVSSLSTSTGIYLGVVAITIASASILVRKKLTKKKEAETAN